MLGKKVNLSENQHLSLQRPLRERRRARSPEQGLAASVWDCPAQVPGEDSRKQPTPGHATEARARLPQMKKFHGPQTRGLRLTRQQELGAGSPGLSHAHRRAHLLVELTQLREDGDRLAVTNTDAGRDRCHHVEVVKHRQAQPQSTERHSQGHTWLRTRGGSTKRTTEPETVRASAAGEQAQSGVLTAHVGQHSLGKSQRHDVLETTGASSQR